MKTTVYDECLMTCTAYKSKIPVYNYMHEALQETKPIVHRWLQWPNIEKTPLPNTVLEWPENKGALCIYAPGGIVPGNYAFCMDVDIHSELYTAWFLSTNWSLEGLLLFSLDESNFDVIPLAKSMRGIFPVVPEMQIRFNRTEEGWAWYMANTGPINATLYRFFTQHFDKEAMEDIHLNIEMLGNYLNLFLGSYYAWVNQPGMWGVYPAKEPRMKIKNGKVHKVYDPGSVGYLEFQPDKQQGKA